MAALLLVIYGMMTVSSISGVGDFIYYNSGRTLSSQKYGLVEVNNGYNEGYQYKDDPFGSNEWRYNKALPYLFEKYDNGTIGTPSSGLRSSVFLGPIGQGGFEIRGDGRFTDFIIFNNAPNARDTSWANKYDLNDAVFGFTFRNNQNSASKIFQTSPLDESMHEFAIQSITYSGSYPTSRLIARDDEFSAMGINSINLTAFSSFEPLNVNMSSIPGVVFWFDIDNRNNTNDVIMDFLFNWPDIINLDNVSVNNDGNGFFMNKIFINNVSNPLYPTTGNMSFTTQQCNVNGINNQCQVPINGNLSFAHSLYENWISFINISSTNSTIPKTPQNPKVYGYYGWNTKNVIIPKQSIYSFAAVLSWYFPLRMFSNNHQFIGHFYNNLYKSAKHVNNDIINKMPDIIENIASWHRLWNMSINAMYPDFLKDVYLNGPGFISRTGYLLETDDGTGIWRQAESWSCYQIDPPHIHQYRSLAYNLIFGDVLDRGTLNMYTFNHWHGDDGLICELYGGDCGDIDSRMGNCMGTPRGDDNSVYILGMYSQFKWYKDGVDFVGLRYQYVKDAMNWIINQSIPNGAGLPYQLANTFDEHGIIGDVNTYSSMIYISALYSMKIMAKFYEPNNITYINQLNVALKYANGNLSELLWQPNDGQGFYRSYWCRNATYPQYGLQSDVLYGYLWSLILDLDEYWTIDSNQFVSHLQEEKIRNWSPFGLQFMSNRTTPGYSCNPKQQYDDDLSVEDSGYHDFDTWEMATIDHAAIALYLNKKMLNNSLSVAGTVLNKYRTLYKDQWDFRDVSSTFNDSDPEYSRPIVNSHYTRQLIHYSIMLAMNGQKLNVNPSTNQMTLELQPVVTLNGDNGCLPILIPQCSFTLCLNAKKSCFELNGLFGEVVIDQLFIVNGAHQYNFTDVDVEKGKVTEICY